ncbi:MAG: hypothetical protein PUE01_07760 [Clostridiaceae bacterium]|nr:hypothetical protein [Clostridiaceae bacterium]
MGFENLYIEDKAVVYKKGKYDLFDFFTKIKMPKKRRFFILGEGIYIKKIIKETKVNKEWIEKVIKDLFGVNNNFLFHYEIKKRYVFFYGITKANIVSKLSMGAERVIVEPIQIYIVRKLNKKIKDKKWTLIFCLNDKFYLCNIEDGILIYEKIYVNSSDININLIGDRVYIDKNMNDLVGIKGATYIEIGGLINAKV